MRLRALVAAVLSFLVGAPVFAQSGANVLVVANRASADSLRIAEHYARVRAVPQDQVLRLTLPDAEEIERAVFDRDLQAPLAAWLGSHAAQDRILFIVLTKGVPLRIRGTSGRGGTVASVDSELALLYRRMTGEGVPVPGQLPNPYFLGTGTISQARLFTHESVDMYLVTRLDGFTVPDVLGLIDRGAAPSREGRFLLDQKASLETVGGNQWLASAATWLTNAGFSDRVTLETSSRVLTGESKVLGYYSWGSNDPAITVRSFGLQFVPGALSGMFVSTDARTFKEPPSGWKVGPWTDRTKFWAASPQSLTGDLIREGVTGAAGHVAEPYLDATIRPDVLFPAYVSGFNLAESYYLAMPYVSWQTVVVGDPLCAPFPRKALQASDIDAGKDPATEWPAHFGRRRLRAATTGFAGRQPEAVRLLVRAEARGAGGDVAGAIASLEESTKVDAAFLAAHVMLAALYEQRSDFDRAAERYRQVLGLDPNQPIALNNLAYHLAVRKRQPQEALGYAEKAYTLSGANPTIADTLGWVQHLLGRDQEAVRLLLAAARALPDNAEVHLHLAVVHAALGQTEEAKQELAAALKLDPTLAKQEEAMALKGRLGR